MRHWVGRYEDNLVVVALPVAVLFTSRSDSWFKEDGWGRDLCRDYRLFLGLETNWFFALKGDALIWGNDGLGLC